MLQVIERCLIQKINNWQPDVKSCADIKSATKHNCFLCTIASLVIKKYVDELPDTQLINLAKELKIDAQGAMQLDPLDIEIALIEKYVTCDTEL
jgi:hypothetical protein